jgi:2-hydroxy-3-keto-5-methylthiopentenyl-1-phosphate phosphatase
VNRDATRGTPASFYLCDFDGTVARADVGNQFFTRFIRDEAAHRALLEHWFAEDMGGREILAEECALAEVDEAEALAFADRWNAIDPDFPAFVHAVRAAGGDAAIASDGLLTYIRRILDGHGLQSVEASANGLVFDGRRITPVFGSPAGEGCGSCGSCKGAVLARRANGYARTVFIGDGLSDRCGARAADVVYAKGDLTAWCARAGIPARPWDGFADIAAAEGLALSAALGRP